MSNTTSKKNNTSLNDVNSLLAFLPESSIMLLDSVLKVAMANKREQVKKQHPYTITAPSSEKGRWQTSYRYPDGKRINIKAATEEALLDKLIPLYFSDSPAKKITFYGLFLEWLDYKKLSVDSQNTIKRHEQHYAKYFKPSALHECSITDIGDLSLEMECNRIIMDFDLSRKEWTNIKTILIGMFKYAVRSKYLTENPVDKIEIKKKFRQVNKKSEKLQVFNTEESAELLNYLGHIYSDTADSSYLAVKLNFYLGLRVGELVALKWSDISEGVLHIVRQEVKDHYTNHYSIVEHTKGYRERPVRLVPDAIKILQNIEHQGEYIFMRDGERITSRRIAYILRKYARDNQCIVKSSHKIRKTYVSRLAMGDVPVDDIRREMGHQDLETTYGYIFNPLTEEETFARKKESLKY